MSITKTVVYRKVDRRAWDQIAKEHLHSKVVILE